MDHGYTNDLVPVDGHFLGYKEVIRRSKTDVGKRGYLLSYQENEIQDILYRDVEGGDIVHQGPLVFGRFAHPNADGLYRFRYFRGEEHGYLRTDADEFECAKFNQRLNPRSDRVGNVMVGDTKYLRKTDDMVASTLAHFPRVGGLITSAPFRYSGNDRQRPEARQPDNFKAVFGVGELRDMILEHLVTSRETLSNFSRTCQFSFKMIQESFTHLAVNTAEYHLLNKDEDELASLLEAGEITQKQIDDMKIPQFAIFTPVRSDVRLAKGFGGNAGALYPPQVCPAEAPLDEIQNYKTLFNKAGFRNFGGYDYKESIRMPVAELIGYQQMLNTISLRCWQVKHVTFERCSYLDVRTVEVILDHMPELTSLGIYSCELIHLGLVGDIVTLVGSRNQSRINGKRNLIDLDIAPPFRQGPIGNRSGSYGITHSDPTIWRGFGTDTGRALTASLVSLERKARQAHVELFVTGKAFRSWLDKLPLQVNQAFCILEAVTNFLNWERGPGAVAQAMAQPLVQLMIDTVQMDLVIAATASPLKLSDFKRLRPMLCAGCSETLPGAFFRAEVHSRSPENYRCEGCELSTQLSQETDHNKDLRRIVVSDLWRRVDNRAHGNGIVPLGELEFLFGRSNQANRIWDMALATARRIPSDKRLEKHLVKSEKERMDLSYQISQIDDYRNKRHLIELQRQVMRDIESLRVRLGEQALPGVCRGTAYDWDFLRKAYVVLGQVQAGSFTIDGPYNTSTMDAYLKDFCMNN